MTIDWAALGVVAVVAILATVVVTGIVSVGIASLTTAQSRVVAGKSGGVARISGFTCVGIAGLIVLYGLYLIVPQFH